ncbi:prolyl aminopeptidase [Yinghuangia soli]|uniref:Proline iminopeptidase n=1 Tax=Yinghuangia soli TaxID=2908204 RepID=A0AA41Q777_9ACTN|nr:prolyl aminopeptidase [Yinghuangia soli]MCF2532879.1 prolyl aminopeptidase [Yinghuangia soli]
MDPANELRAPYDPVEPYAGGMLDVGDGNRISWEVGGNPAGKPAVALHGGPGSGRGTGSARYFDPAVYRIVRFDQRGCGRSTPHAADPGTDMRHNTTGHLVADLELLRAHLGIERWLMFGGSWGSTLLLAYAQRHPERVAAAVIAGVTTTRRAEIDWLYRGAARFFPAAWARFRDAVPEASGHPDDLAAGLVAAYARRMADPDPEVRSRAAAAWCAWEDAVLSLEPHGPPSPYTDRVGDERLAFVRICTHYFAHAAWLDEGELLRGADRLAGIPAVLVHGALDMAGPLETAWELSRAWPGARLDVVGGVGHKGGAEMLDRIVRALDGFGAQDW